jgi:nitroimidazol reductase NimA-like FMN-containing flavoprotein (pyridoxamine 5'-phosphate oxidase superfamily)
MTTEIRPDNEGVASLEELTEAECMNYLAGAQVGRIALVIEDQPAIFPVNYILDGEEVLYRTGEESELSKAGLTHVAFEVDHIDPSTHQGWSVLVQGRADDLAGAIDGTSQRLRRRTLHTWAPGTRDRIFVIRPSRITGRRLRVLPLEL